MGHRLKVKIPCPECGAMLDGGALAALLGAEYVKLRKHPSGGRHGGRPAVYDHSRADCPCWRCRKKERSGRREALPQCEVPNRRNEKPVDGQSLDPGDLTPGFRRERNR